MQAGTSLIELLEPDGAGPVQDFVSKWESGLFGVGFSVDDPDAAFARAVGAGGKVVSSVEDKEYGWRVGRVVDPFGHHWEIGKPLG